MPKFILTVARDATAYFTATVEADDLEALKSRMSERGYTGETLTPWESSYEAFDHVEYYYVNNEAGEVLLDTSED